MWIKYKEQRKKRRLLIGQFLLNNMALYKPRELQLS